MAQLTSRDLGARLHGGLVAHYATVSDLMKGITIGVAAFVLLSIILTGPLWLLGLWFFGLMLAAVTHFSWRRGALLVSDHGNWLDTAAPFSVGAAEIIYFLSLVPPSDLNVARQTLLFLTAGALIFHGLSAAILVLNRLRQTQLSAYESVMQPLVEEYRRWMKSDWKAAGAVGMGSGAAALLYVLVGSHYVGPWVLGAAFGVLGGGLLVPLFQFEFQRKQITDWSEMHPCFVNEHASP